MLAEEARYLEQRLREAAATGTVDHPLDRLEADVWARVEALRATAALAPARAASVGLALVFGLTAGGMTAAAARPSEMTVFSVNSPLAASALLDGRS